MNIQRRQLDKSQVALALAKLANMAHGSNRFQRTSVEGAIAPSTLTLDEAAEKAQVSRDQIKRAKSVLKRGAPELVEAVERGDVSISAAAEVARLPEPEQRIVAAKGADAVTAKAAEIREERKAKAELPESHVLEHPLARDRPASADALGAFDLAFGCERADLIWAKPGIPRCIHDRHEPNARMRG